MAPTDVRSTAGLTAEPVDTPVGGRVQLALNVSDVDAAVDFYTKLFGVGPAKRRPGYANFAITSPPLKLVLIENADARGTGVTGALNHLGVEVADTTQVGAASQRLTGLGLDTLTEDATTCCYAVQDKVWVHDPDGAPWEVYTVLSDASAAQAIGGDGDCCGTGVDAGQTGDGGRPDVVMTEHGVPLPARANCC